MATEKDQYLGAQENLSNALDRIFYDAIAIKEVDDAI
jgi:hypothetical protein